MKNKICLVSLFLSAMFFASCTDLDETLYDQLTPDEYVSEDDGPVGIIYSALMGSHTAPYTHPGSEFVWMVQTSTDEVCVPIRTGGDWKDGYTYQQFQKHTWDPNNKIILSAWNYCFNIIGVCNVELKKGSKYSPNQQAQIRLVRAYAYLRLMDMFGNVPIIDENYTDSQMPEKSDRADVYNFVRNELNDPIMDNLKARRTSEVWNKGILHTLKARLYLNSKVYTDCSDADYMLNLDSCIMSCDSVKAMNKYEITDYFKCFYTDNDLLENSRDIICSLPYKPTEGTEGNYLQLLGFAKLTGNAFGIPVLNDAVNGPCVNPGKDADDTEALFKIFDAKDIRKLSIFSGQIYDKTTGKEISIIGQPINYTPYFTGGFSVWNSSSDNVNAAKRGDGARMLKYEMVANQAWEMENDLVLMRYTEVLYMRAEALIRLNRGGEAISIFNEVLLKRGYDGAAITVDQATSKRTVTTIPLSIAVEPTLEFMEKELRREFIFEDHRRTDMIRFGKFTTTEWGLHTQSNGSIIGDPTKNIFPIPADILSKNTKLKQNPGYN